MDKERIKYEIKKHGYSNLKEFCKVCKISESAMYRKLNRTSSFTLDEMVRISKLLGYSTPAPLFFENDVS